MKIELQSIRSFSQLGQRDHQEDARYPDLDAAPVNSSPFFVVCDGVGGEEKGEVASATVCNSIGDFMEGFDASCQFTDNDFSQVLGNAYDEIMEVANELNSGMATTLTFVAFHAGGCFVAHIGDSRVYHIRPNDGIVFRTQDHSLVNALLRSGNITPDQVDNHPRGNTITRCISPDERANATVTNLSDIREGDYLLLCTDGCYHEISDNDLVDLLSSMRTDDEKIRDLASRTENSDDNNTAILIHIGAVELTDEEKEARHEADAGIDEADLADEVPQTERLKRVIEPVHDVDAADPTPIDTLDRDEVDDDQEDEELASIDDELDEKKRGSAIGSFFKGLFKK